ncbi:MAG: hypothetical protein QM760_16515 [Nibricoccus sp.]
MVVPAGAFKNLGTFEEFVAVAVDARGFAEDAQAVAGEFVGDAFAQAEVEATVVIGEEAGIDAESFAETLHLVGAFGFLGVEDVDLVVARGGVDEEFLRVGVVAHIEAPDTCSGVARQKFGM